MSEKLGLGSIITTEQQRDAIHIAVAPVTAVEKLFPGQRVVFEKAGKTDRVVPGDGGGIVDPFLKVPVFPGQRCWMYLDPGSITSLRHDWTHPMFAPVPVSDSERWLRDFAKKCDNLDYDDLLEAARSYAEHGDYFVQGGRFEGLYVPDEFWPHYEAVTGTTVKEGSRGSFFSCSC